MKTLQQYTIRINYKPSSKLKFANALSCLYICFSLNANGVENSCSLLMIQNKNEGFPAGTSEATKAMVLNHKGEFSNVHGTIHYKSAKNSTAVYLPVSQQVDTILWYHQDLRQTCARYFYEFLNIRCWWFFMSDDIKEVLQQFEICKRFVMTAKPPKSVILVTVKEPLSS